jgi:hypothetical protein
LAILLSLLAFTVPVGSHAGAIPAVAIVVYDHGLTNQINYTQRGHLVPGNKTSVFTEDDRYVYAYFTAALASANITWLWIDPGGQVFLNQTQQLHCDVSPCSFTYWFLLGYTDAATKFGLWTVTLQAGGINLYSDYFSVVPVILQDDYWTFEVTQSAPPRVHGNLTVTIHPDNGTWSSYLVYLPFATNITAYELPSKRTLDLVGGPRSEIIAPNVPIGGGLHFRWPGMKYRKVAPNETGRVVVNLGGARSDGYRFALSFDVVYGLWEVPGGGGVFVFNWQESGWGTFDDGYHYVPASFNITLPATATFLDIAGINAMTLNPSVTGSSRAVVGFRTTLLPGQSLGWTVLYLDSTYVNSHPNSGTNNVVGGFDLILAQSIPFLHLTLAGLGLWVAVMSVLLLTGSEFVAPAYSKTGPFINRRRLRIAALIFVGAFLALLVYAIILLQSVAP